MSEWLDPVRRVLDESPAAPAFFFRDDDVGRADGRLAPLLVLFAQHAVPIDLAVIPQALAPAAARPARPGAGRRAACRRGARWADRDHAPSRAHGHGGARASRRAPRAPRPSPTSAVPHHGIPRGRAVRRRMRRRMRVTGSISDLARVRTFLRQWCDARVALDRLEVSHLTVGASGPLRALYEGPGPAGRGLRLVAWRVEA